MEFVKLNTKMVVCFKKEEIVNLLLTPLETQLFEKMFNSRFKGEVIEQKDLEDIATEHGKKSAKSKQNEIWVAFFSLCQDIEDSTEICFYLKDTFNYQYDEIKSIEDLEKFKDDPPDVVIKRMSGEYIEFELKIYDGEASEEKLFDFIDEKIFRHYSDVGYNFCITLKPKSEMLSLDAFEKLHEKIKKTKNREKIGKICLIFNVNNQFYIFVHLYPEFSMYKIPFETPKLV